MLVIAQATTTEENSNFLVSPDVGLMIWTVLAFLVAFFILRKWAWPAISEALDKRQRAIEESIDASERTKAEADELLAEYRQALADSRREATKIIEEARRASEQQRSRDIADLEAEKNRLLKRAKDEIVSETRSSLQAFIFATLTAIYLGGAVSAEH